jgi:hypothetical protein
MTALCYAALKGDAKAYQGLQRLGASDKKDCMNRVEQMRLQSQTKKTVSRQRLGNGEPIVRVQQESQVGKYAAVGLAAAGVATAAVLLSHDGGHSHHYTPTPDSHSCPTGQKWNGEACVDIVCPSGHHLEGNVCVPDEPTECPKGQQWNGTICAPIQCPTGQHLEGNECVANDNCPTGQRWNGSQCVTIECEEGTHLEGDICVSDTPTECPTGQRKVDGVCVAIECPENTHLVGKKATLKLTSTKIKISSCQSS